MPSESPKRAPTLREHLEAIIVRGYQPTKGDDRADAIAALGLLDAAERCGCVGWLLHMANETYRFVPDPEAPDE